MTSNILSKLGSISFIAGLAVVILVGMTSTTDATIAWIIGLLGIIVGLLNIQSKETQLFLISAIAFMVAVNGLSGVLSTMFGQANNILHNMVLFVAPAAGVVSLKAIYGLVKN